MIVLLYLKTHMWGERLFRMLEVLYCSSLTLEQMSKETQYKTSEREIQKGKDSPGKGSEQKV